MNRFDVREAGEVAGVEGEDAFDAVDVPDGGDAGIVDLDAGDGVINEESAPLEVNIGGVWEQGDSRFDRASAPIGLGWSQAISVAIGGPRQSIPEFPKVL